MTGVFVNGLKNLYLKRGSYWFSKMTNGKRVWVNLQTGDPSTAIARAQEIQLDPRVAPRVNLASEVRQFVAHKLSLNEYSRQSSQTKIHVLREFSSALPESATSRTVTTKHVAEFYNTLRSRVTESTALGYMMTLRSFFRWCVEENKSRFDNPVSKIRLARVDRVGRKTFCSREQKRALIANATNDELRFILFCGFDAGMRKGEIIEARVDWFSDDSVSVRATATFRPKDREARTIPLTRDFAEFLKGYLDGKEASGFALRPRVTHGKWRYRYDFRKPFANYMRGQGMEWVTPHVMRHSFASILAGAGCSIFKISTWLGDGVRVVQRHYAKLSPTDSDIHLLS